MRRRPIVRRLGRLITLIERRVSCVCVIKSVIGAMEEVIANLVEAAPDVFISDLGRIHVHRQRVPILVDHPIRLRVFLAVADGCQQIIRIIQTAVEKGGGELMLLAREFALDS